MRKYFIIISTAAIALLMAGIYSCKKEKDNTIAVTGITGVPAAARAGVSLALTGTVNPAAATNKTIVWSVANEGTTGATISGSTLNTTAAGTVTVRATITNGASATTNYAKDFTITVSANNQGLPGNYGNGTL
jgi:hypothetical protein